jgi:hypothetical protein
MTQKKVTTKSRRASNGASAKATNGKGAGKTAASKSNRNGSGLTANELTLRAWKKSYENRDRFGKF